MPDQRQRHCCYIYGEIVMKKVFNKNFYEELYLDMFIPDREEFYTIIHFHGGGLVEGDKGDTHEYCESLANKGFAVATANYSLMPDAHFPDFLYDAAYAIKYVVDHISKYGRCKGFIISGASAGGWITLMLCLNKEYLEFARVDRNKIVGFVSESGQPTTHFNILEREKHLNPWVQRIDEAAPIYYVDETVDFSRLLLVTYEKDLPNRVEQNDLLMSSIKFFKRRLDVHHEVLDGGHCAGSTQLNEDGEYEMANLIKEWVVKYERQN